VRRIQVRNKCVARSIKVRKNDGTDGLTPDRYIMLPLHAASITSGGRQSSKSMITWKIDVKSVCVFVCVGAPCGPGAVSPYPLTAPPSTLSFRIFYFSVFPFLN